MFDSIFTDSMNVESFFIMLGAAILSGLLASFIMSLALHSSKRFFVTSTIMPAVIAIIVAFVNGQNVGLGAGVAIGGAFGLTRFRSAQGTSEEIGAILITAASGIAFGMGYIAYGVISAVALAALVAVLTKINVFSSKAIAKEKLVRITIPEDLNYEEVFKNTFEKYTNSFEYTLVKTSDMGSLYKLTVKVKMKDVKDIKDMIDEIRQKNANMEVAVLPALEGMVNNL